MKGATGVILALRKTSGALLWVSSLGYEVAPIAPSQWLTTRSWCRGTARSRGTVPLLPRIGSLSSRHQIRRRPMTVALVVLDLLFIGSSADATIVRVRAILPKLSVRHERNGATT